MPMLLPPHPLQALPAFTLRICKLHFFLIDSFVDFLSSMPNVSRARFSIIPFDNECGPSNCPQHLLFTNEEGVVGPVEVIPGAFDIFRDTSWLWVNPYVLSIGSLSPFSCWFSNYFRSIDNARRFTELRPFVNVSAVTRSQISADAFRNHVLWQNSARSVIFTMIGIVQSCHVVTPTTLGQHLCKAITIVPYGHAWRKFLLFLGQLYGEGEMKGPYEYGCLLTLLGRRSGWSTAGASSVSTFSFWRSIDIIFQMSWILLLLLGKTRRLLAVLEVLELQSLMNGLTTKSLIALILPRRVITLPVLLWLAHSCGAVPIYDASSTPFLFQREDFVNMPNLPLYHNRGKISDLPVDSLVSVFFSMSSYAKKTDSSSTSSSKAASGSPTFKDVLSLNIQSVVYYGTVPSETEDEMDWAAPKTA